MKEEEQFKYVFQSYHSAIKRRSFMSMTRAFLQCFNPTIVRLKVNYSAICANGNAMFQSYHSAIKSGTEVHVNCKPETKFQSYHSAIKRNYFV